MLFCFGGKFAAERSIASTRNQKSFDGASREGSKARFKSAVASLSQSETGNGIGARENEVRRPFSSEIRQISPANVLMVSRLHLQCDDCALSLFESSGCHPSEEKDERRKARDGRGFHLTGV